MEDNFSKKFLKATEKVQKHPIVSSIRNGLVNMIPVLIIGAFSLILKSFPVKGYTDFIATFANGLLLDLFNFVYSATFGVLSVYMTFSISRSFMKIKGGQDVVHSGAIFVSILCFFMLAGSFLENGFDIGKMGPKSMLLAIISGLGASYLYLVFYRFFMRKKVLVFAQGADLDFNRMISTFLPIVLTSICFALFNLAILRIFKSESFHDFYIKLLNDLFSIGEVGFLKGFFFVLLSSVLWFFGVHGSDALEGVMQNYFYPGLLANQEAIANGLAPTNVLTKEFFDCFVLMGGCGAAMCLLIAILIFSKSRSRRSLGLTAAFPMIFNINELMVFGLPIIFNPIMLIPFLLTPLVCYTTSYLAIYLGIVPMITSTVEWTTPIFIGGYYTTGSIAGSLLQLFNLLVGILIYFPFVRILDRQSQRDSLQRYEDFVQYFRENEQLMNNITLTELKTIHGSFAKELCADLKHDLLKDFVLYYQPKHGYDGKCLGVEALLRWHHKDYGDIYPPMVIKLANECGILVKLEEEVMKRALEDRPRVLEKFGPNVQISVNVTAMNVIKPQYVQFIEDLAKQNDFKSLNIELEVTEQSMLILSDETRKLFSHYKELGLSLVIDDFSMGQTSLQYLKYNVFDCIKIDGSLITGLMTSTNCKEIIYSIIELAESLNISVVAEFVETEEQKEILHSLGCDIYQGYLYSKAVSLDE